MSPVLSPVVICFASLFLVLAISLFLMWRHAVSKYSLKNTEKLISGFREEFNSIVSEKLDVTEQKAVEITARFNSMADEIEYFNARMREARTLILKLDNTSALIEENIAKSLSRDEAIMSMNKELEDMKSCLFGSSGNLSATVAQLASGMEKTLVRLRPLETGVSALKKEFDDFERVITSMIGRIKALESER